jgi:hypothetical protein
MRMRKQTADLDGIEPIDVAVAIRDGLRAKLSILRGEAKCIGCGTREGLRSCGSSKTIAARCATCEHIRQQKAEVSRMRELAEIRSRRRY